MAPRIGPEPDPPAFEAGEGWRHAIPFGIGFRDKPHHYLDLLRALWDNRKHLLYARRILKTGVCDGCSLGPAGLRDDVSDGMHLCSLRLNELKYLTSGGIEAATLADVRPLESADAEELLGRGRIASPLRRSNGEASFTEISWDEALDLVGDRLRKMDPRATAWLAGGRALSNEGAFVTRQVAQVLGCPNLDSTARFGYAWAAAGIADVFGVGAPTCSLKDVLGTDLLVLWGVDPASTHPVFMKYLHLAKEQGTRVALVNPERQDRLVKYWVPSEWESALWGTRILDDYYAVQARGDVAFAEGVLKTLDDRSWFDNDFLAVSASGQPEFSRKLRELGWKDLERASGASQADMERFAGLYSAAKSAVFVVGKGVIRQADSLAAVRSISTLAASRGMVGKKRCGVILLGESGEQGAIDLGIAPAPGGLNALQLIKAAQEGRIEFLCSMGGNLLDAPVDRAVVRRALGRVGVRVHVGAFLDSSMLVPPADMVVVLPSQTRYETAGGLTSTSAERRVRFSPEIPGPRLAEPKAEWQIPLLIAQRVDLAHESRLPWTGTAAIRAEIERAVPRYRGIAGLKEEGQWIQWGGERLFEKGQFDAMPGRRCRLQVEGIPGSR